MLVSLMARRPYKVAAVALANRMARTIWALLVKGGVYEPPAIMVKGWNMRNSSVLALG